MTENDHLLSYLAEHDPPCPGCGYNLRGLSSPNCPECGQVLRLSIAASRQAFSRLWLAMTVLSAVSAGLGIATIILIYVTRDWPRFSNGFFVSLSLYYFVAAIPLTIIALFSRRLFLRLNKAAQRGLAGLLITINCLAIGWLIWFMVIGDL